MLSFRKRSLEVSCLTVWRWVLAMKLNFSSYPAGYNNINDSMFSYQKFRPLKLSAEASSSTSSAIRRYLLTSCVRRRRRSSLADNTMTSSTTTTT